MHPKDNPSFPLQGDAPRNTQLTFLGEENGVGNVKIREANQRENQCVESKLVQ